MIYTKKQNMYMCVSIYTVFLVFIPCKEYLAYMPLRMYRPMYKHVGSKNQHRKCVFFGNKRRQSLHLRINISFFSGKNGWIEEFWLSDLGCLTKPNLKVHGPSSPDDICSVQCKRICVRMT